MSFLSGYIAEKYDVEKEEVYPRVKERAVNASTDVMRQSITGYDSVSITNNTIDICKNKWSHFLMPIWLLSYKYQDTFYHFAINGQTGKFAGDLPIDKKKVAIATTLGIIAANAAVAAIMYFGGYLGS
jgi:hypothetical protein